MDEFVELRDERGLTVRAEQGAEGTGQPDLRPDIPDEATAAERARIMAARLEERGILEALRGP
jgi:hypothetical protein